MGKLVRVRHDGKIMRTVDDNVEFEQMAEYVFMFGQLPSFSELVDRVKLNLGCLEDDLIFKLDGVIDVSSCNGPRVQRLAPIKSESDWLAYKEVVMSSEVRSLDLIVTRELTQSEVLRIGLETRDDPNSENVLPRR